MIVYFAALTKILGGLGPLGSASVGESALYCLTNLLVRVSFAILQGYILRVLTTGDPDEMRFRNKLDALNYMSERRFGGFEAKPPSHGHGQPVPLLLLMPRTRHERDTQMLPTSVGTCRKAEFLVRWTRW